MTKPKKTPWFPATLKPTHHGWYNTDLFSKPSKHLRRWDGERWVDFIGDNGLKIRIEYYFQEFKWRGLTKPAGE